MRSHTRTPPGVGAYLSCQERPWTHYLDAAQELGLMLSKLAAVWEVVSALVGATLLWT